MSGATGLPQGASRRVARWTGAWSAALVSGAALTLALVTLLAAAGDGGATSLALALAFLTIGIAAVLIGRRVQPRRTTPRMELPVPAKDDYSGLPAPPHVNEALEVVAVAGAVGGLLTVLLFPFGLGFALVGACLGWLPLVIFGLGMAAVGPAVVAAGLVFGR